MDEETIIPKDNHHLTFRSHNKLLSYFVLDSNGQSHVALATFTQALNEIGSRNKS